MAGTFQFSVHGTNPQGNYWATIWHFSTDDAGTGSPVKDAIDVGDALLAALADAYAQILPEDVTVQGFACRRVSTGGGPTYDIADNFPGERAGNCQAAGICADIAWYPGTAPWKMGHTYVPGVSIEDLVEGNWTADYVSAIDAFIVAIMAPVTTDEGQVLTFVIWRPATESNAIIQDGLLRPKPTLMNRRLRPVTN